MNILVTGGAGYLGSVLCEVLLDKGYKVIAIDSLLYKQKSLFHLCNNPNFDFVFGDDTEQTIEKVSSSNKTTETQSINHTYTKSGNFTASVLIPDDTGKTTDPEQLCQVDVAVGGLLARGPTTVPTIPPQPTIKATPTLQASAPTDSPTRIPTTAPVATDTPIPVPKLPESGAFIPTALAVVGGAAVILLGILL